MTTELMEVFSLEVGDQILIKEDIYKIFEIGVADVDYLLYLVDENGYKRIIQAEDTKKFKVIVEDA